MGGSFKSGGGFGGSAGALASGGVSDVGGAAGGSDEEPGGAGGSGGGEDSGGAGGSGVSGYPKAVLSAGPLVYWRMSISSGRVVPDESGHGNDLVLQGTGHGLRVEGAIAQDDDRAMRFDGAESYAIATDARVLDFAARAPFSLEAWARRETGGGSYFQHLFSNTAGSPGARNGFMLYLLPEPGGEDNARSAFEYDSVGSETGLFGPLPPESVWAYYVAVYDGTNVTLYVDATLADTRKIQGIPLARTGTFAVARASNGGLTFFKGALDELAIYARALTLAEISKHYELGARR
jgi:hypothetical protein